MPDDLFARAGAQDRARQAPLADRMRPQSIDEIRGQAHILGPGKLLRRAISTDRLSSVILWGQPGTGKTSLASVISKTTDKPFRQLNAVTDGLQELRKLIKEAEDSLQLYGRQTLLFIDEIHRFNKSQQDGLLPYVENGTFILIGATTQNPYFSVNPALLSRSLIFELYALKDVDIVDLMKRALQDKERGLGNFKVRVDDEAFAHLAHYAQGDVRKALNALELAVFSTPENSQGLRHIDLTTAEESIQQPAVVYDKTGDDHYDIISAFIKSMRGSDPQAALHYLARMLHAGEDPLFIARRMVIFASEDIGMACPEAVSIAQACADSLQFIGMPEGRIILGQGVVFLSEAPKSNASYLAINAALSDVRTGHTGSVPNHLKDSHYSGSKKLGHGKGYLYPHDFPGHVVDQSYLPEGLKDRVYYIPDETVPIKYRGPQHSKEVRDD